MRSGWEISFAINLDKNPSILEWSSESIVVIYYNVVKKRSARYFLDFWIRYKKKGGTVGELLVEIKPSSEVSKPVEPKKKTAKSQRRYFSQIATYMVNTAKWEAAEAYCETLRRNGRDITFKIITEKDLFVGGKKS
jgi:hypothetical protein